MKFSGPTDEGARKVWAFYIMLAWATGVLWLQLMTPDAVAQVLTGMVAGFFVGNGLEHAAGRYYSSRHNSRHDP